MHREDLTSLGLVNRNLTSHREPFEMKPLISYYGGKQRIASKIVPLIPPHTVYVEPFCGGASIMFAKGVPEITNGHHYREVLNDKDERLVNLYRVMREQPEELIRRLMLTLYSEAEHKLAKEICSASADRYDPVTRAWAYYVNIQQSFSNTLDRGWSRKVYGRNNGATWANKVAELYLFIGRMKEAFISSTDALICIDQWDSPQTFFFCDPPYPESNQGHYGGYTEADLQALVAKLDSIQGSFLLTCYGTDVPESWERYEIEAYSSASGTGLVGSDRSRKATKEEMGDRKRTEVVYRRLNQVPVREELVPVLEKLWGGSSPAPVQEVNEKEFSLFDE